MSGLVGLLIEAINYLVSPVNRRICYLVRYKTNIDRLRKQKEVLDKIKDKAEGSVTSARMRGEMITGSVTDWQEKVATMHTEVTRLFAEIEEKKGCLEVCFSTCCSLSKEVKTKIDAVEQLVRDGEDLRKNMPDPPSPPPSIEIMPTIGFQAFKSTKNAMNQVIKALEDDEINLIGVCGMGGVGKTTLVKEVAKQVKGKVFDKVVMVTISKNPIPKNIQGKIAEQLSLSLKQESEEARARKLFAAMKKEKNILIILDDVWKPLNLVDDMGIPYGNGSNCKVVFTTRYHDVCSSMRTQAEIVVDVLSERDSWVLFQDNAGLVANSTFGELARKVAKECKGLPIAIVTLGRALQHKGREVWLDAARQLKKSNLSDIRGMNSEVFSSIKLSYDYLENERIKQCFQFCCLFPEDYEITVEEMMIYGFGEGIFGDVKNLEAAKGRVHTMFANLRSSCLLLEGGTPNSVVMHDVVRDVGISIASEENGFLVEAAIGLEEWPDTEKLGRCKRMSLMYNKICSLPGQVQCPQLLTLLLSHNESLEEIPDKFFEGMKALTTLDLSFTNIRVLPSSFSFLTNLRTLSFASCHQLVADASLLGKLKELKILNLRGCSIDSLPAEIGELTSLKLLDLSFVNLRIIPPTVISRLSRLEELHTSFCFDGWNIEGAGNESRASISEVASLTKLSVLTLKVQNVTELGIGGFNNLKYLNVQSNDMEYLVSVVEQVRQVPRTVFNCLEEFHLGWSNLKGFCNGPLPNGFLHKLRVINISSCNKLSILLPSNLVVRLRNLEVLKVSDCKMLMEVFNFEGLENGHAALLELRELTLNRLYSPLTIWNGVVPPGSLRNLKSISMYGCKRVKYFFSLAMAQSCQQLEQLRITVREIDQIVSVDEDEQEIIIEETTSIGLSRSKSRTPIFQNLRNINIHGCSGLKYFLLMRLAQGLLELESLTVVSCDNMEVIFAEDNKETEEYKMVLPRLRSLCLYDLPSLSSLCPRMLFIDSPCLEELDIHMCWNLKKLPLTEQSMFNLRKIDVEEEWFEVLEWDEDDHTVKHHLQQIALETKDG